MIICLKKKVKIANTLQKSFKVRNLEGKTVSLSVTFNLLMQTVNIISLSVDKNKFTKKKKKCFTYSLTEKINE